MSVRPWEPPADLQPAWAGAREPDKHVSFKFEAELAGGHVHVKVRVASRHPSVQVDHSRGLCGELVMDPGEYLLLRAALEAPARLGWLWTMEDGRGAKLFAPAGPGVSAHEGQRFIEFEGWPE